MAKPPAAKTYTAPPTFYRKFERKDGNQDTTHYCPGCGHGHIHKYIAEALHDFGLQDRAIVISPVGCSVFAYYYIDAGNVQVAHGRSPAVATGLKRANPDAIVVGYQGDGDLAAIGGNAILQAAYRGENYTVFFINNAIYGMTGGQMAPTTLLNMKTTTSPRGRGQGEGFPIRVAELINSLTAPYYIERVALGDNANNRKARAAVRKALQYQVDNKGFSLVEILSPCPTGWKMQPVAAAKWTLETMPKVFPLGVFRDGGGPELGHPWYRAQVALADIPKLAGTADENAACLLEECGRPITEARVKIAGLGGQGVLLIGQLLAQAGMLAGRQVCWMPSYGPEMRGGTASCSVTIADAEIGSPLIQNPTVLVAMNGPSVERFGKDIPKGGTLIYNASMVPETPSLPGVRVVPIAANAIADSLGDPRVQNMVMLGAVLACDPTVSKEAVWAALPQVVKSRPELIELNKRAINAGIEAANTAV